jgi:outer membrane protein assembly factor BamB
MGTGFVMDDIVQFGGVTAVVSGVNAKGTRLTTSVPPLATTGQVTVTDPFTGQTVGIPGTVFVVTTGVSASPNHVWAGESLTLAGSGLSPDQSEQIMIGTIPVGVVRTNATGGFQIGVSVPFDEAPGRTKIAVIDPFYGNVLTILYVLTTWPQLGYDLARTADNPLEKTLSPSTVSGMTTHWNANVGGYPRTGPTVSNGLAFMGADDDLVATDVDTGAVVWSFPTGDWLYGSTPAVADGIVYFTSQDGDLYAVGASDGHFIWRFPVGAFNQSAPLVANGVVYIGSYDGYVYALGASDGHFIWAHETGGPVRSSPSFAKGIVYVGCDDHNVYRLKAKTGQELWHFDAGGEVTAPVSVSGGTAFVPSGDGFLYAVSTSTLQVLWYASAGTADFQGVAVANGVVYLSNDYFVEALDAATGGTLWRYQPAQCGGTGPPAYAGGIVYVSCESVLFAMDAAGGFPRWSWTAPGNGLLISQPPSVANGVVYAGVYSGGGFLYAFGL